MPGISFARGNTSVNGPGQKALANLSALSGHRFTQRLRHFNAGDMDDDRIVRRPAFDLENFCDGLFIQRVGGEAIDRFRRQRDHFAGAQQFRRAADGLGKSAGVCVERISAVTPYS